MLEMFFVSTVGVVALGTILLGAVVYTILAPRPSLAFAGVSVLSIGFFSQVLTLRNVNAFESVMLTLDTIGFAIVLTILMLGLLAVARSLIVEPVVV